MIISKSFKAKYPDWETHVKLLPKEIICVSLPSLENTIQLDLKRYGIYITEDLFFDRASLEIYLKKVIKDISWRPDNWVNPYSNSNWDEGLQHEGFEEGASAMLGEFNKFLNMKNVKAEGKQ